MIKVSVLYPNSDGCHFDAEYYCSKNVPFVVKLLGGALKEGAVDLGVAGGTPGSSAPFVAMGHLVKMRKK